MLERRWKWLKLDRTRAPRADERIIWELFVPVRFCAAQVKVVTVYKWVDGILCQFESGIHVSPRRDTGYRQVQRAFTRISSPNIPTTSWKMSLFLFFSLFKSLPLFSLVFIIQRETIFLSTVQRGNKLSRITFSLIKREVEVEK